MVRLLMVVLTASCTACGIVSPETCTDELLWGIRVRVLDAVTGAPIAAGAQLLVSEGAYADSASAPAGGDSESLFAAGERAGVYNVLVRKAGYANWSRTGVEVTKGACHVRQVTLTASLSPL